MLLREKIHFSWKVVYFLKAAMGVTPSPAMKRGSPTECPLTRFQHIFSTLPERVSQTEILKWRWRRHDVPEPRGTFKG